MYHNQTFFNQFSKISKIIELIKKKKLKNTHFLITKFFLALMVTTAFLAILVRSGVNQSQDNRTLATYQECTTCDIDQNMLFDSADLTVISDCISTDPSMSTPICNRANVVADGILDIQDVAYCAGKSGSFGSCLENTPTPTTSPASSNSGSNVCSPVNISQLANEFPRGRSHCGGCDLVGANGCWNTEDYVYTRDVCFNQNGSTAGISASAAPTSCQALDITSLAGSDCGVPTPTGTCQAYDCYPEWNQPNQYPRRDGFLDNYDIAYCSAECACATLSVTPIPTSTPQAAIRQEYFTPPTMTCRVNEAGGVTFNWSPSNPPPCTYDPNYLLTHPGAGDNPTDTACQGYWIQVSTIPEIDPTKGTFKYGADVVNTYTYATSMTAGRSPGTKLYGHVTVNGNTIYPDGTFGNSWSVNGGWIWSNLVECTTGAGAPYSSPTPTPLPGARCSQDSDCANAEYCIRGSTPRYCKPWTETTCSQFDGNRQACTISGDAPCSWLPTSAGACNGRAGTTPGASGLCLKPGENTQAVMATRCSATPPDTSCQSQPGGECGRGRDCCGSTPDPNHGNLGLACSIETNFVGKCNPYNGGSYGMGATCSCPAVDLNGDGVADYRDYNLFQERCAGKPVGWSDGQVTCSDYDGNGLVMSNGRGADNDTACLMSCIDSYRPTTCNNLRTQAACEGTSIVTGPVCRWYPECNLCDDPHNASIPGAGVGCTGATGMGQGITVTPTPVPNRPACSSVGSASGLTSYCYESSWCGGGTHTCIYNTYNCAANECCCVPNELAPTAVPCRGIGSSCDAAVGMCCTGLWCESGICIDPIASGQHDTPPVGGNAGNPPSGSQPRGSGQSPISPGCNAQCQTNFDCDSGFCYQGSCRASSCPTNVECSCGASNPTPSVSPQSLDDFIDLLSNQNLLDLFIQFLRGLLGSGSQQ